MKKKISTKVLIISIITILLVSILYFLFAIVDLPTYLKNRDWLKEHGERAKELHEEIEETNTKLDNTLKEIEENRKIRNNLIETIENNK